jgi:hypothetical protein
LHKYLKLYLAGVFLSDLNVSHKTRIFYPPLNGSLTILTGFRYISLSAVVAYSVDEPSYVHHSKSSKQVTLVVRTFVLLLSLIPVPSIQIYSARVNYLECSSNG